MLKQFILSIMEKGGASWNIMTDELNPEVGFFATFAEHQSVVPFRPENLYKNIKDYYEKHKVHLLETNRWLGVWVHEDKLYLDIVRWFRTKRAAKRFAIKEKQISFFDNKNNKTIFL